MVFSIDENVFSSEGKYIFTGILSSALSGIILPIVRPEVAILILSPMIFFDRSYFFVSFESTL